MMDELWKRMGVLPVLSFLLETLKSARKNMAWAMLVTQSLEDLGSYAAVFKTTPRYLDKPNEFRPVH